MRDLDRSGICIVLYRNHRGDISTRRLRLLRRTFGCCPPWHPDAGWLIEAVDVDKGETRTFAEDAILEAPTLDWLDGGRCLGCKRVGQLNEIDDPVSRGQCPCGQALVRVPRARCASCGGVGAQCSVCAGRGWTYSEAPSP